MMLNRNRWLSTGGSSTNIATVGIGDVLATDDFPVESNAPKVIWEAFGKVLERGEAWPHDSEAKEMREFKRVSDGWQRIK